MKCLFNYQLKITFVTKPSYCTGAYNSSSEVLSLVHNDLSEAFQNSPEMVHHLALIRLNANIVAYHFQCDCDVTGS